MNDKDLRAFAALNVAYDALLRAERMLHFAEEALGHAMDEDDDLPWFIWRTAELVRSKRGNLGAYIAEFRDARAAAAEADEPAA